MSLDVIGVWNGTFDSASGYGMVATRTEFEVKRLVPCCRGG